VYSRAHCSCSAQGSKGRTPDGRRQLESGGYREASPASGIRIDAFVDGFQIVQQLVTIRFKRAAWLDRLFDRLLSRFAVRWISVRIGFGHYLHPRRAHPPDKGTRRGAWQQAPHRPNMKSPDSKALR
jgi:hypothetical protein